MTEPILRIQNEISEFLERLAGIAEAVQTRLMWLLGVGVTASALLAWQAYSPESAIWWNVLKCGLIMVPALIWSLIWLLFGQLQEAPEVAAEMLSDEQGVMANLKATGLTESVGVRSIFKTLLALRREEGFAEILETIGSVSLLTNPLFVALAFVMMGLMMFFVLLAPLLLLF